MDKTTRDVRLAHWTEVVKQCQSRPTGMTIRDWVNENGINEKQYHYWQRRVREEVFNKATSLAQLGGKCDISFTEVPESALFEVPIDKSTPDAVIKIGNLEIELHNSLSPTMLRNILEVAAHAR